MTDEIETAFSGRITTEPVQRISKSGKPWLSMNVAVGSGDAVQFVSVALFGDTVAETAERLHKGDRCYVEGKIRLNTWTDANGKDRSGLAVSSFHAVPLGQIGRKRPAKLQHDAKAKHDSQAPAGAGDFNIPF